MKNSAWQPVLVSVVLAGFLILSGGASALEVNLTLLRPYVEVELHGGTIRIDRVQDQSHELTGFFAQTSRKCPPFCIQPAVPVAGVKPVAEVEIFDFLTDQVKNGTGILIDVRTAKWHRQGTIPGSVNYPLGLFVEADANAVESLELLRAMGVTARAAEDSRVNRFVDKALEIFGATAQANAGKWDFSNAKELVLFCNGAWCDQSPRAIKALVKMGYPTEKLYYYRGGINAWIILGLTTVPGE